MEPDLTKVDCLLKLPYLANTKQVQQALGGFNYYGQFIDRKSDVTDPLFAVLKKGFEFKFGDAQKQAFNALKTAMAEHPVLAMYDPTLEVQLRINASDVGVCGILLQKHPNGWRPIAYSSKSLNDTQRRI